jgi:hypothetical protein
VCPNQGCETSQCPTCNAVCGEPKCTLECQGFQPCHSVCETPRCRWECSKPSLCPKPKCSMVCESPATCPNDQIMAESTHTDLPPVGDDEYLISSFNVPHVPGGIGNLAPAGLTR